MKKTTKSKILLVVVCCLLTFVSYSYAKQQEFKTVLFKDANIFNGMHEKLIKGSVLVEGNKITKIGNSISVPANTMVIDAKDYILMPGFIDAHTHLAWNTGINELLDSHPAYISALTLKEAKATLMRGFTTIRDITGPTMGIRQAIDQGLFEGPRIYTSGAGISMTSGHADFRYRNISPRQLGGPNSTAIEYLKFAVFADGVPEVLTAAREQFRQGADFLKLYVGGAVTGLRDPLDIAEYSFEELKAAADEAKRWNTYLAVHAYTDKGVTNALNAGAISIEHATLITEPTVKLLAQKGAFLSAQTGVYLEPLPDSFSDAQKARQQQAAKGLDNLMKLAKKHKVKIALGSDLVGSPITKSTQNNEFTNRTKWFTNLEILIQATSLNAELLAMCGPRNPYPGKLGVIEEGAYADILLVNGDPLKDITILSTPEKSLVLIMKGGKIYKNTINQNSR